MTLTILDPSRARRLKAMTHHSHDGVDRSIMEAASFDDVAGYARFLAVQYLFHRDIAALYDAPVLQALLPGLAQRKRLALVEADLADLDLHQPETVQAPLFSGAALDVPTALGWLYVAEGSNMGAALLRKEVAKIGLSDSFGARHLAPAPEGPAAHWRAFTAALDAVEIAEADEPRTGQGANAAFLRVQALIDGHID
ncbi:biliverdin-producing heme oxygenase [Sphingobium yanoikuyae]|uniref:Biliverdin-producing heme oxygenase n=1 Tax=Sphingobium yanoikuyae TaxID=13690 RepID=A0A291MZ95_SPHYA|nr:biliverdin-producing heme oxygenase [Sphingobium yanoikuyae]ATI80484.1 biliverdin-producing heme oxygenase [Sphingobium yanoikuyae]